MQTADGILGKLARRGAVASIRNSRIAKAIASFLRDAEHRNTLVHSDAAIRDNSHHTHTLKNKFPKLYFRVIGDRQSSMHMTYAHPV